MRTNRADAFGIATSLAAVLLLWGVAWPTAAIGAPDDVPPPQGTATIATPGGRLPGRVVGTATDFRFEPDGGGTPMSLASLDRVDFESAPADPVESPAPFRVLLNPGGQLAGHLDAITAEGVRLETGPGDQPLSIRRAGVRAVVQRPGEVRVFADDFETGEIDRSRWSASGTPHLADDPVMQGRRSLRLPDGGASVAHRLTEPIGSGRFEVAYFDEGRRSGGRSRFVDLAFRGPGGLRSIRILLGWEGATLAVLARDTEPSLAVQPLVRRPGWHRLAVRFGPDRIDVAVDGMELAHGDEPGGPLVEVRLASDTASPRSDTEFDAYFDDLRLVMFTEVPGLVEVEPTQDEVRLISGDQLFGLVRSADSERVTLAQDDRIVTLAWSEVVGVHLRRQAVPSEPLEGLWVRLRWRPDGIGDDQELNYVEGVLEAIDAGTATVRVPYVGPVVIPIPRLTDMAVLGPARRIILDPAHHHLGNRVVADLDPPQPEGRALELTVPLESSSIGETQLALDVVQVIGVEGDADYSRMVRAGELRTVVTLNGRRLGDLNSLVTRRNDEPLRVRLPIPGGLLRAGSNTIRFEQHGTEQDPDMVDNLGLLGIALESPLPGAGQVQP